MEVTVHSTFKEACVEYLKRSSIRDSKRTFEKKEGYLKRITEYLGNVPCNQIDKSKLYDLILYRKEMNEDISNTTLNMYVIQVTSLLKEMFNIDLKFKKLRETKKLPGILDEVTIQKVYKYLDTENIVEHRRNKLMFMMLLDTGLRISELLSIKASDINYKNKSITVKETKSKEYRRVLFTSETSEYLARYVLELNIREYLFINFETRKPLRADSVETICRRIQHIMGIKQSISPHKWRHTFASNFIEADGNVFVLKKLLGHHDISTTQIYVKVSMKKTIEEYNRVQNQD